MRLNSRLSVTSQLSCSWIHTIWVAVSKIITSWDFKIRMNWNATEVAYAGRLKLNICGIFPTEKPQSKQKLIQYEAGYFDAWPWISWWVDGRGITKRSTPRAQTDCPPAGRAATLVGGEAISPESQTQNPARGWLVSKPPPQRIKCKFWISKNAYLTILRPRIRQNYSWSARFSQKGDKTSRQFLKNLVQ